MPLYRILNVKYIHELMEPKGWSREDLNNNINLLLDFKFIEDAGDNVDLEK